MKPGPPPKPTKLNKLAGNPGHRPVNKAEPKPPQPDKAPYAPRHLNDQGKKEWRRIIQMLIDFGLYTEFDQTALSMYCQALGRWIEAENKLVETGGEILESDKGNFYQNPWLHIANRSFEQMRKMLGEFGFSPAQRSRLQISESNDEPSLAEALFRMING